MTSPAARHDRDLRARIIDVATRLFADQGFAATSVRQLVEACLCTKPSLYYYFDGKETLYREVVALHIEACSAVIEALDGGDSGAREAIHNVVSSYIDWAEANPWALRLLQRIETRPEEGAPEFNIAASREFHLQLMAKLLERGIASGELRAEVDPFDCALVIAGSVSFQFEMDLAAGRWHRDRVHRTVDLIFDGISA